EALSRALHELAERHETLRTAFTVVDDVPHQLIMASASLELQISDLTAEDDAEARAAALVNDDARQAFDLSTGPLMRASLLRMGPGDHILLLTAHHIIVDAWSMTVLNRELSALYGGFVSGAPAQLPELPIQYADYAVWQQEWLRSGGLDQQLGYWTEHLAGAPVLLELPTDHPRPPRQSFRGATVRRMLPVDLLERVHALGEREGATSFMTLLGVFAALMSRYSGQEEIVVASPVANRSRVELEGVIGLFVNTLAMRVDLDGNPSFGEVLRRVRETSLGAFSNQDLPFEKLVEELNPERHLSHAPVAQVLFVMHNAAERQVTFPGLDQERLATDRGTAKFDLSFFAAETPDGLRLSIEYCSDLFEEATVLRMLDHYRALLEAAVADPNRSIGELTLLSEGESDLVLGTWNETERAYPSASRRPVHELVAEQARRSPDQVAVQGTGAELSYAELDLRAEQLARYLRDLGVGPDVVVAVCAERSVEMVVGVLATLKAGGAYAPIDPAYPTDRVAFMLADSGAPVVLTQQHLAGQLPSHDARTVCLDTDWEMIAAHDRAPPEHGATLDSLAYVIYTSGSTGRPKGVAMSHRPLANLLAWQLECWSGAEAARTLQFASLSFDVAFQEIFSTLCSGGTLVLPEEAVRRDPQALLALLDEQRVQRLFLPFVALQNLSEAADYLQVGAPHLRQVITAGEQLKATDSVRSFFSRHPNCTLVNQYGPTESHVVTAFSMSGDPEQWPSLPPIGSPIANAKVYLLDRHQQPVPIGVPGELHIGGVSLAREYLGRPELTNERFVTDPFGGADARMYRTGDRARYLADGNVEFLGRTDHQVKIRGFRIEPGEIESALRDHSAVREALVFAQSDTSGENRLIAYLIGNSAAPSAAELRDHLRRTLPDYMIPSAFVTLDAFPVSPNGKIDRNALPAPDDDTRARDAYTPPSNADEHALVEIWERLLKVERVGTHDSFFALGGHSLLATQVVSRVRDALDLELPLRMVFEAPTVASFARAIEELRDAETTSPAALAIQPLPRESRRLEIAGVLQEVAVLPASYAEQRLWFLDRLEPGSVAYNLA
ncbi:MAG: amino acid adenylation domain-containing protein, partial [Actinomycetota bacterium]|nr:amino acid adenylation domain-containing protein [Actinomycetota bacterium]